MVVMVVMVVMVMVMVVCVTLILLQANHNQGRPLLLEEKQEEKESVSCQQSSGCFRGAGRQGGGVNRGG